MTNILLNIEILQQFFFFWSYPRDMQDIHFPQGVEPRACQ